MGLRAVQPAAHLIALGSESMATPSAKRLPHDFFDDAQPFKLDGVYCKLIPLTQGQFSLVWVSDYANLSRHTWCAAWNACTKSFYAWRGEKIPKTRTNLHFAMHREVLGLQRGDSRHADHVFHDTLDNRRMIGEQPNLRIASHGENMRNKHAYKNSITGIKGVRKTATGKFEGRIRHCGVLISLGFRATAEAAHRELYVPAARALHGEFARFA